MHVPATTAPRSALTANRNRTATQPPLVPPPHDLPLRRAGTPHVMFPRLRDHTPDPVVATRAAAGSGHVAGPEATGAATGTPPSTGAPGGVGGEGPLSRLVREVGQPELAAAVVAAGGFPGFAQLVEVQEDVLARLTAALGVVSTGTKHTDAQGVMRLQSLQPGKAVNLFRSYRTPPPSSPPAPTPAAAGVPTSAVVPKAADADTAAQESRLRPRLRTMTQILARYITPDGAVRVYSKTTASPLDDSPTPQLDVEIGGTETSLIVYVALGPKASLTADLPYLEHYYCKPPPALPTGLALPPLPPPTPPPPPPTSPTPTAAALTAADVARETNARRSLKEVEAEARRQPSFVPFVSPSLWVRAQAAVALCFSVEWDGGRNPRVMAALRRYVAEVTDIWLAHLLADTSAPGGDSARAGGGVWASDPWAVEQWRRAGVTLRNHVRHDPLTPLLYPVYGEEQVTKWIETVAGEE